MKMTRMITAATLLLCLQTVNAADWGHVSGKVVVTGDAPKPVLLHSKGAAIKDAEVCASDDTYSESVVIGEDGGLANVLIFPYRYRGDVHPDLKTPAEKEVIFDQKACKFIPHVLIAQVGQTVKVLSDDAIAHNTHTYPIRGKAINNLVAPNDREGLVTVDLDTPETMPIEVKCDFHAWMNAYWLILDHPYAAATKADGSFTIENLPAGDHKFRVWHEKIGWIKNGSSRDWKVTVKADGTAEMPTIEVDGGDLKD